MPNLTIFEGQKVGLLALMAQGKSSLFAMIKGEIARRYR